MKYIFKKESIEIPDGFRSLTDEEIAKDFKNRYWKIKENMLLC